LAAVAVFVAFLAAFFALAQRAFIAADIAALPFALSFLFLGFVTLGTVDLGWAGPFLVATSDSNALACCNLDISVSISAMMRFVSMNPPLDQHKRRIIDEDMTVTPVDAPNET
jgi:hypothetical protein